MFTAIQTKFHGAGNVLGSRISAETMDTLGNGKKRRITVDYNHAYSAQGNHMLAAKALAKQLAWAGQWRGGGYTHGYVFVRDTTQSAQFDFEIEG